MVNDEKAKLRVLLNYWIEHNQEHGQEFREWADKARALGEAEAGASLGQAAQEMDKATKFLSQARKRLEG
jgi:hypothetical protein